MPKVGVGHDYAQTSLSHSKVELPGEMNNGDGRTIHLASDQGMTSVQWHVFTYPVLELCNPAPRGMR